VASRVVASATAVYGARAANGIIMITTKSGEAGKLNIDYSFNYTMSQPADLQKKVDAFTAASFVNRGLQYDGRAPQYTEHDLELFRNGSDPQGHANVDWQKVTMRNVAPEMRHNLILSGGSEAIKIYTGLGYYHQQSIYKVDSHHMNRYNFRTNLEANLKKIGLKVDPNHPFLNFNLAELYKEEKLYKEAINSYQTAMKTKPNWYEALTAIADCYVEMEELRKAIETYKIIIGSISQSEENFTKLAKLYEKVHEDKYAEDFYKKAVSVNGNFLPAVLGYADMLKAQKRYFDAYNILINNKEKYPDNKELLLSTAEVCLMLEDYAKAKEILNHLSKEIKGDKDVLKMQGKLYSVLGDTKKAELIFEHLLQSPIDETSLALFSPPFGI